MPSPGSLNDMIIDIDTNMYGLQVKVARFVTALLSDEPEHAADINLSISRGIDDEFHVFRCVKIYIDPEDEIIRIATAGGAGPLAWESFDVAAQYMVAQHLYGRRISNNLYRTLSQ
jgi:hypothetical protein